MDSNTLYRMLGVQSAPSGGFVSSSALQGLGDDGSVMMISGLGTPPSTPKPSEAQTPTVPESSNTPLSTPIKLFNVELPLWAWLVIAALLGGAGGYYLGTKKEDV